MAKKFTVNNKISISEELHLQKIKLQDYSVLYGVMKKIYPPAYIDYWKDDGVWYVNDLYNKENFKKELTEEKADYFFVVLEDHIIGIIRIVYGINTDYKTDDNYVKLHRLYLDQTIQNKGLGYKIMIWLIESSEEKGYKNLWLEVMEKQQQALYFYEKLGFYEVDKVLIDFPLVFDEYRGMFKMVTNI